MTRASRVLVGLIIFVAVMASLYTEPARAAKRRNDRHAICFVGAIEPSGPQSEPGLTRSIDTAIQRTSRGPVVSGSRWREVADEAQIELRDSLRPPALTEFAANLKVSAVLVAYVVSGDSLAARIELLALDPSDGAVLARSQELVSIDFGAGASSIRLSNQQAERLVVTVLRKLKLKAPPKPSLRGTPSDSNPVDAPLPERAPESAPAGTGSPAPQAGASAPSSASESPPSVTPSSATAEGGEQTGVEPSLDALLLQAPEIKLGANIAFTEWAYFMPAPAEKVPARHDVSGTLIVTGTAPLYTAALRFLARADFADPSRNRLEPEEGWVEVGYWGLRLRAGRNVIVWEPWVNGLVVPASPITPIDAYDLVRLEALPLINVRLAYDLGPLTFEGYYLPVPARTASTFFPQQSIDGRLVSSSRWYPTGLLESRLFPDGPPPRLEMAPLTPPPPSLENGQGALRVMGTLAPLRFSVAYAYMFSLTPVPVVGEANTDGVVPINIVYPRIHMTNVAAALNVGYFSGGLDLIVTALTDLSRIDAAATVNLGFATAVLAEYHRFGGGVLLVARPNLLPTLATPNLDAVIAPALAASAQAYGFYGLGRFEVRSIVLQSGALAPNGGNLTQLSLKLGSITTALALLTVWGTEGTLFGAVQMVDRVELTMRAAL